MRLSSWVSLTLSVVLLSGAPFTLTGCFGGKKQQSLEGLENKDVSILVRDIYQMDKMGKLAADGQLVIMKVSMVNNTSVDKEVKLEEFALHYYEENELGERPKEPTYIQHPEKQLKGEFTETFGQTASKKLMSTSAEAIHPRIETNRYFVFSLPKRADFEDYKFVWTPPKKGNLASLGGKGGKDSPASKVPITVDLVDPQLTKIHDNREQQTY